MAAKAIVQCRFIQAQPEPVTIGGQQSFDVVNAQLWRAYYNDAIASGLQPNEAELYANLEMAGGFGSN